MSSSWLRVINYTDTYTLENFPSLKTLIERKRAECEGSTIVLCSGDFLAPYLLSSLDQGEAMVRLMNALPVDVATIGNHEDDVPFVDFVKRVQQFRGTWVSSNMHVPECGSLLKETHTLEVGSRKIGIVGVLSDSPALYRKNAFGGAQITDPYDALERCSRKLKEEEAVDFILPVEHLYVPQDLETCRRFDFPIVISGHDHHVVDQVHHGTRLLKAGADAKHAVVLDIRWADSNPNTPVTTSAEIFKVSDFPPDPETQEMVRRAYFVLDHLKHTQVCRVSQKFRPLSSEASRSRLSTVGCFLWSSLRDALNTDDIDESTVDCVVISGGDIRGGTTYPDDHHLSLADLRSEIQEELEAVVVEMPGAVLAAGIRESHEAGANPGFLQFDDGIHLDINGCVTHAAGKPLDPMRSYRVATTMWSLKNGSAESWVEYFKKHPEAHPQFEAPVLATLLMYFSGNVWRSIWKAIDTNQDGVLSVDELAALDTDNDGKISRQELAAAMRRLGFEVDDEEMSFVNKVMEAAGDRNGDGFLDHEELGVGK